MQEKDSKVEAEQIDQTIDLDKLIQEDIENIERKGENFLETVLRNFDLMLNGKECLQFRKAIS